MTSISVKVCFVMDCTASMAPWIRQAKTKIVNTVRDIKTEHANADIKVAFVGYRDYGDDCPIIVHDFKRSAETMRLIQDVHAEGGDDEAEDVANALERALHLNWSDASVCNIIHIADAPAHGKEFHSASVSDRFPRGDPSGLDPRDFVERMSFLDIDFTFIKTNETTNKMIDEFAKCYTKGGNFRVVDLVGQVDSSLEFSRAVSRAVSDSIMLHTSSQAL